MKKDQSRIFYQGNRYTLGWARATGENTGLSPKCYTNVLGHIY